MADIEFALVLNLHQPVGNLEELLDAQDWQAREILWAIDRIPRSLWRYEEIARVHLSLSGTLLETLADPDFQHRVYGIVDCGSLLWYLQNTRIIEVLGTGYYHPVLPLIRPPDREEHLHRWRTIAGYLFAREHFSGFWPPELGFSMDLVPALCRHRYRYVIVDSEHVAALTPMRWEELRYRPHVAQFGGEQIVVVVRDRDLSNAQESGMDPDWFIAEVNARTQHCDFPPLVTTATDGENGGWFRNTTPGSNFWSGFHSGLMEKVRAGRAGGIRPTFISDYLERHGPHGWVTVGREHGTQAAGSFNGPAPRPSSRRSPASESSAKPSTPRAATRSRSAPATQTCTAVSRTPSRWSYGPRRAATSSGGTPGCNAATTTSTTPPGTSNKPKSCSTDRQGPRNATPTPTAVALLAS